MSVNSQTPKIYFRLLVVLCFFAYYARAQFYTGGRALPKLGKRLNGVEADVDSGKTLEIEQSEEKGLMGDQHVETRLAYGQLPYSRWRPSGGVVRGAKLAHANNFDNSGRVRRRRSQKVD